MDGPFTTLPIQTKDRHPFGFRSSALCNCCFSLLKIGQLKMIVTCWNEKMLLYDFHIFIILPYFESDNKFVLALRTLLTLTLLLFINLMTVDGFVCKSLGSTEGSIVKLFHKPLFLQSKFSTLSRTRSPCVKLSMANARWNLCLLVTFAKYAQLEIQSLPCFRDLLWWDPFEQGKYITITKRNLD